MFTYLFDLFPTVCEVAGAKPPERLADESLRPLWAGEKKKLRDSVFLPYSGLMRAVRDERWKLIAYPPINHRERFDLRSDPGETKNLAADPRRAAFFEPKSEFWNVPLVRGEKVVERPADQNSVTKRYTEEAVKFIRASKEKPFFL